MRLLNRVLIGIYFLIWTICIALAYAYLSDRFYRDGGMLPTVFGVFTAILTLLVLLILLVIFIAKPNTRASTKKAFLLCLAPLILMIPYTIIYFYPNTLEKQQHTIQVSYMAWACDCANWAIDIDNGNAFKGDEFHKESVFIEPAKSSNALPDSFGSTGDIVQLTGQFYSRKGFPKGYYSQEWPDKARVFRYTRYKIICSNDTTLLDATADSAQSLKQFQSKFNMELKDWTTSFRDFKLSDFRKTKIVKFENIEKQDLSRLDSFLLIYKHVIAFSMEELFDVFENKNTSCMQGIENFHSPKLKGIKIEGL